MKGNRERYTLALCMFVYASLSTYVSYHCYGSWARALGARLMAPARAFDYIPSPLPGQYRNAAGVVLVQQWHLVGMSPFKLALPSPGN